LFSLVQAHHFNKGETDDTGEQLTGVQEADLLILDDLGAEFSTIVTDSALFDVVNQRLLDNRSTVISSNLTIAELRDQYTERIVSRFLGSYKMFKFFGDDIREKKRYQQAGD
jgi:DNA replication protein DnaC